MRRPLLACCLILLTSLASAAELPETDWLSLMPPSDRKALENMPEITHNGPEANGTFTNKGGLKQSDKKLPQVMYSTKTVAALNGKALRLGGYPVPLENDAKGRVTEFFLVPYPGACIHVPPPPSNQIVHVKSENGVMLDTLYQPFWIEGTLKVAQSHSDLAESGYAMQAGKIYPYEIPDQ